MKIQSNFNLKGLFTTKSKKKKHRKEALAALCYSGFDSDRANALSALAPAAHLICYQKHFRHRQGFLVGVVSRL